MDTIKSSQDINYIFKNGQTIKLPFITLLIYKDNNHKINGQAAFIAGKKYGNAVWRNKNKRRLREIYKNLSLSNNNKIILIANKKTLDFSLQKSIEDCNKRLLKFGCIND